MFKRLFKHNPITSKLILLFLDSLFLLFSIYIALLLRFDGSIPKAYSNDFICYLFAVIPAVIISLFLLRIYQISLKYMGLYDVLNILKGNIIGFFCAGVLALLLRNIHICNVFPKSVILIGFFISFLFVSGFRLIPRIIGIITKKVPLEGDRTLIVGAGDAGEQVLRNIMEFGDTGYLPVGFIDDDLSKNGFNIHGVSVIGTKEQIPAISKLFGIQSILIAIPSASITTVREIIEYCRKAGIKKIKILPNLSELISGRVGIKDARDIHLEDLIHRQEVKINLSDLKSHYNGKVILVTGVAGSIGSELCHKLASFSPNKLIILDQDETRIFELNNYLT